MMYNQFQQQYTSIYNRIKFYLRSGKWHLLSFQRRARLLRLLDIYAHKLIRLGKPALTSMALGLVMTFNPIESTAQSYEPCSHFQALGQGDVTFGDIDNDGDQDAFVTVLATEQNPFERIRFFRNVGNPNIPNWAAPVDNPFGIAFPPPPPMGPPVGPRLDSPVLVDIDGDDDLDLFMGRGKTFLFEEIVFFENLGNNANPVYGPMQSNPFGIVLPPPGPPSPFTPNSAFTPTFVDIDDDDDYDLFTGDSDGSIRFYRNVGDPMNPSFAAGTDYPFGIGPYSKYSSPEFFDIDDDNDYDIFVGSKVFNMMMPSPSDYNIRFQENVGNPMNPSFSGPPTVDPFGIITSNTAADPVFVDIYQGEFAEVAVGGSRSNGGIECFEDSRTFVIPTLSQWGIIILGLFTGILGIISLRNRSSKKSKLVKNTMMSLVLGLIIPLLSYGQDTYQAGIMLSTNNSEVLADQLNQQINLLASNGIEVKEIFSSEQSSQVLGLFLEVEDLTTAYAYFIGSFKDDFYINRVPDRSEMAVYHQIQTFGEMSPSAQYLLSIYRVENQEDFLNSFNPTEMESYGMNVKKILPYADIPRFVSVIYEVENVDAATSTMSSPAFQAAMTESNLVTVGSYFMNTK